MSVEPLARLGRRFRLAASRSLGDLRRAWDPVRQAETAMFVAALGLVVASAVFGGASQTNALSLMLVELASLPLLFLGVYLLMARAAPAGSTAALGLLGAIVLVPLLQIAPLPFEIWLATCRVARSKGRRSSSPVWAGLRCRSA